MCTLCHESVCDDCDDLRVRPVATAGAVYYESLRVRFANATGAHAQSLLVNKLIRAVSVEMWSNT